MLRFILQTSNWGTGRYRGSTVIFCPHERNGCLVRRFIDPTGRILENNI